MPEDKQENSNEVEKNPLMMFIEWLLKLLGIELGKGKGQGMGQSIGADDLNQIASHISNNENREIFKNGFAESSMGRFLATQALKSETVRNQINDQLDMNDKPPINARQEANKMLQEMYDDGRKELKDWVNDNRDNLKSLGLEPPKLTSEEKKAASYDKALNSHNSASSSESPAAEQSLENTSPRPE